MMSETKLAIDDLYDRIKDQNKKRVVTAGVNSEEGGAEQDTENSSNHNLRSWIDKLHALQFRVLDLQDISTQLDIDVSKKVGTKLNKKY